MHTIALLALLRSLVWAVLLYVAIRHRSMLSIAVVVLAWIANALVAADLGRLSGTVGIATASLIVYLLIDRLDKNPAHVKRVATEQVTEARHAMHDARSDARAWEARCKARELLLKQHHIDF